jgi:hypothetical protein
MADNQAFEACAVSGRLVLSFLGIGYDGNARTLKQEREYKATDDVKVTDVGGRFVEIDELTDDQRAILARFIHGVHKACAHFTWNSQHSLDVDNYKAAAALIIELYEKHLKSG